LKWELFWKSSFSSFEIKVFRIKTRILKTLFLREERRKGGESTKKINNKVKDFQIFGE